MNRFFVVLLGAMMAPQLFAADLTGHWVATQQGRNGQTQETDFFFKSSGDTFTGYMHTQRGGYVPIVDGKVDGNKITFVTVSEQYDVERRQDYTGEITDEGMTIHPPAFGGRAPAATAARGANAGAARGANAGTGRGAGGRGFAPRDYTAKRVSTDTPPKMPEKIDLGPLTTPVKYNGQAKTPQMGWNSWNKFRNQVSDKLVREIADGMVRNGMKAAGYIYVNIDDTWEAPTRAADGSIQTNERFPDMKALADYIHSKGLKFGIYSSPGPTTCAGYLGSFQHEDQDAKTYAKWGVDYLKYDWCSAGSVYKGSSMPAVYAKMGLALLNSGRPILYSLCQYGVEHVENWGAKAGGNSWRDTGDISDNWNSMSRIGFDSQQQYENASGPGHWNDPDMLEIGNGGMTDTEYRTHMSLWSLLAAPLLAGNDLRDVPQNTLEILTNKDVIAIDQDPLGKQAHRISKEGDLEIWARPLKNGDHAVGLFNRGAESAKMTLHASDAGIQKISKMRDLWKHAEVKASKNEYETEVPSHGVVLLRVSGK